MSVRKKIFIINGSASGKSSNQSLIERIAELLEPQLDVTVFAGLKSLPHFDPQLSDANTPEVILELRRQIDEAAAVIMCAPEYVFSIPSGLKNAIEWCVATVVFSYKPMGIITAAGGGQKAHEEAQMIMRTLTAKFNEDTTWLIQGVKGKINDRGEIIDPATRLELIKFVDAIKELVSEQAK